MNCEDKRNTKEKSWDNGTFGGIKVTSSICVRKAGCNLLQSNSTSASEDDIDELENPEENSPDAEWTYFGEIRLTDLNSVPSFRKDLHCL